MSLRIDIRVEYFSPATDSAEEKLVLVTTTEDLQVAVMPRTGEYFQPANLHRSAGHMPMVHHVEHYALPQWEPRAASSVEPGARVVIRTSWPSAADDQLAIVREHQAAAGWEVQAMHSAAMSPEIELALLEPPLNRDT